VIGLLEHYSCLGIRVRHVPIHLVSMTYHSLLSYSSQGFRLEFSDFVCQLCLGPVKMSMVFDLVWCYFYIFHPPSALFIPKGRVSNSAFKDILQ